MFCQKMSRKIKRILGRFDQYADRHIDTALQITIGLKKALSSPVADIITELIPGNIDNIVKQHLLAAINTAVDLLTIADQCQGEKDINKKLQCFVAELQKRSPEHRDAVLQKLASLLACELDGKRLKQNLYDLYTQAKYAATKQE
jgi:hypothetical protein